jgi:hypothetical protein
MARNMVREKEGTTTLEPERCCVGAEPFSVELGRRRRGDWGEGGQEGRHGAEGHDGRAARDSRAGGVGGRPVGWARGAGRCRRGARSGRA